MTSRPALSSRAANIPPFHVMELLARAHALQSAGHDIIHMEVGEPDFPTPPPIIAAAQRFLAGGDVRYTQATGLPELRDAIFRFYRTRMNANVPPHRIIITAGASAALLLAIAALTDPGDEWLLTDPGYPCNRQFIQACNGVPRALQVEAGTNYQPEASQIRQAWSEHSKGLLVASPANPTGALISAPEVEMMNGLMQELGGTLIVDEIYQGLVYDTKASSVLAQHDNVFVVNSFSKYFGMTGWRLGWLVVPEGYERHVEKLAQHLYIAASTPAQHAALAAFTPECIGLLEERRALFARRRDLLVRELPGLGFRIHRQPEGAFYIYANTSELTSNSQDLALRLLEKGFVAATPGADFGDWKSDQHLRLAYTTSEERLMEALTRIRSCL
ncbi:pyridoxal phosphate-dependent aminotransferase [Uliginosibacterium paludis]|uniref:Aminotransferase n=1 Tax=Uliginosibacterium paludis TaxID=1615952 RepID=A0ABV2CK86_9RHOO